MILELILTPIFLVISGFIALIPDGVLSLQNWLISFVSVVKTGLSIFPPGVFTIVIANISFWLVAHMTWAIIEWLYKKIPGVD